MLGMVNEGVAPVRVRALAAMAARVAAPTGRFTMQLGSFTSRENAVAFAGTLQQRFNGVHLVPARLEGETVYRVRMGTYQSRDEARRAAQAVAGAGYDVVVMEQE
jgi:septal ring-binding cell division protein DamX